MGSSLFSADFFCISCSSCATATGGIVNDIFESPAEAMASGARKVTSRGFAEADCCVVHMAKACAT